MKDGERPRRTEKRAKPTVPDHSGTAPEDNYLVDGKYTIKDLVDLDALRRIFEKFSQATGLTTGLVTYPGQELLISTGWQDICTKFHRAEPASAEHCKKSNKLLTSELNELKTLSVKACANGLIDGHSRNRQGEARGRSGRWTGHV